MNALWYRARAEMRARWRAWLALGGLAGALVGAIVFAAAAAQRTDTVVERRVESARPPDVFFVPFFSENGELIKFDAIARFEEVAEAINVPAFAEESYDVFGPRNARDAAALRRQLKVIRGRMPRETAVDEVTVNVVAQERRGVRVGDTITLRLAAPGWTGEAEPPPGPEVRVRVVGVTAELDDLRDAAGPAVAVSTAFVERFLPRSSQIELYLFRLRRGEADLPAFNRHLRELTGGEGVAAGDARSDRAQITRSFRVQAIALWLLAGFLAIVTAVVLSQMLVRQTFLASEDDGTLGSLGISAAQVRALHAVRGAIVAVVASVLAALGAILGSPLAPFGRARLAEPSTGFSFPWAWIAVASGVVLTLFVGASVLPTLLRRADRDARARTSPASALLARGSAVAPSIGMRFALEGGRGRSAVPVRSTLFGCGSGILALVMALTVGRSLDHLLTTPRLYGWSWDAVAVGDFGMPATRRALEKIPGIAGTGYGVDAAPIMVDSVSSAGFAMEPGKGDIPSVVLDGRAPRAADEVALGRKTLDAVGGQIGSVVTLGITGTPVADRKRVVGVVVLPVLGDTVSLGEGALVTWEGTRTIVPPGELRTTAAFVKLAGGAGRDRILEELRNLPGVEGVDVPIRPRAVVDFGNVRQMPLIVAAVIALLAAATLAHLLISSIRRRQRDLAILKTIGFRRAQVAGAIAWQSSTVVLCASLVAIPLGVAAGRWAWALFARYGGFAPEATLRTLDVTLVVAGGLVLANAIAVVPARFAARTPAAVVLRTE